MCLCVCVCVCVCASKCVCPYACVCAIVLLTTLYKIDLANGQPARCLGCKHCILYVINNTSKVFGMQALYMICYKQHSLLQQRAQFTKVI